MQLNIKQFPWKKRNTTFKLKEASWQMLATLLNHGYPLVDALAFLDIDQEYIKKELEQGKQIQQILLRSNKGDFNRHMRFFIEILSFPDAIESSITMVKFKNGLQKRLLKKAAYPLCVFIMAYILLWFFTINIIPQMLDGFLLGEEAQGLKNLIVLVKILCTTLTLVILVLILTMLYLHYHKRTRSILLMRFLPKISILQDYQSFLFAGYLLQMEQRGISTIKAFQYLTKIHDQSVFELLMKDIEAQLLSGNEFLDILKQHIGLNKNFKTTLRIGACTNQICEMLKTYMQQQEVLWEQWIKKMTILIQCVSYLFVGFVVIIVYQIMLVPLSMLEQF